jgi:hypothetical protein
MIAFWTWLWGPIGLVLATPLTVCLMVISKSVPDLEFIGLLPSSEAALDRHQVFYQRLVAKDRDEALDIVESWLKEHSPAELFDRLLIPTLISCRHDYERDRLTDEDWAFVFNAIRQILEEEESLTDLKIDTIGEKLVSDGLGGSSSVAERPLILGCPANDEADELALMMLSELLHTERWNMRVLSSQILSSEGIAEVENTQPVLVCIGSLARSPLFPLRQFCKRLRLRMPQLLIVVGRWGGKDQEKTEHQLTGLVEAIGWDLAETKNQVIQLAQVSPVPNTLQKAALSEREGLQASKEHLALLNKSSPSLLCPLEDIIEVLGPAPMLPSRAPIPYPSLATYRSNRKRRASALGLPKMSSRIISAAMTP